MSLQHGHVAGRHLPCGLMELLAHLHAAVLDLVIHLHFIQKPLGHDGQGIVWPALQDKRERERERERCTLHCSQGLYSHVCKYVYTAHTYIPGTS